MRASDRDRRRSSLASLCLVLILASSITACYAAIPSASYDIFPNGTTYHANVEITEVARYEFADAGVFGEPVTLKVSGVTLSNSTCSKCPFNWSGPSMIIFAKGNYTLDYVAPVQDYHLQASYRIPYYVNVTLPPEFDVRNPLLAVLSPGANITITPMNSTIVEWKGTRQIDLRFYDRNREAVLFLFGNIWLVIAIVLILPFLLTIKRQE